MLWDEVLDAGEYAAHALPRGSVLRLTDLDGDACAHVALHHADLPSERLNLADTTKVQWQMYPSRGSLLLSDRGRVLAAITDDTSGRHDTICSAPNRADHDAKYGDGRVEGPCPNARDRLIVALAKFGLEPRDLPPTISFFKGVRVDPDGALHLDDVPAVAGDARRAPARARRDRVGGERAPRPRHPRAATPAPRCASPRGAARRRDPTTRSAHATPETHRAYLNTDDWLLGRAASE